MEFVIEQGNDERFHWRLLGDDGAELAVSATGFDTQQDAHRAAETVRQGAGAAGGLS
jgi:uncharacterized protein YegP (UPF0339 family)